MEKKCKYTPCGVMQSLKMMMMDIRIFILLSFKGLFNYISQTHFISVYIK